MRLSGPCRALHRHALGLILITLLGLPGLTRAQGYEIFKPPPATETPDDTYIAALRKLSVLAADQDLAALSKAQQAALEAVRVAQTKPSMATAVALLSHFETFAAKDNDGFRRALADAAKDTFLMADAAKYELIIQANKRMDTQQRKIDPKNGGIVVSLRVGSTGLRFAQWQQWVAAGQPMEGAWQFTDPFSGETTSFEGMPLDDTYRDAKLMNADDDVSNWASNDARAADPLANERINGDDAALIFAKVTADELARLPDDLKHAVRDGKTALQPSDMMVEYLSPTKAHYIMGNEAERARKGWQPLLDMQGDLQKLHFLAAWDHAQSEKYNGLYAAEQLHAWGLAKGYVTEDVQAPLADGSSKTYKASAESGVLKDITGSDVFPQGIKDPFGWMATNYRQIFVTHSGDLDSVAKYTLRMIDWWSTIKAGEDPLRALVADSPGIRSISASEFEALKTLADGIRNAPDAEAKVAAIDGGGGKEAALQKLKELNQAMLITGQRTHMTQLTTSLTDLLQQDAASRTLQQRIDDPLTFEKIIAEAERRGGDTEADPARARDAIGDPYVGFAVSINAYANGYANLPEDVAQAMALDIAEFVDRDFRLPDGEGLISAEVRMSLLPVLEQGVARARAVATNLREDAHGMATFSAIAESEMGKAISKKLVDLGEPDLRGYLKKIKLGQVKRRKIWMVQPEDGRGWPEIHSVDEIWHPADIGNDFKRIMWLGQKLGWTDAYFAERVAAYFNGPEYRSPAVPLPDGAQPKQSHADRAIDAYLAFSRLFERASSTSRVITMTDADGNEVVRRINGTNLGDELITTASIAFEQTLRGAEAMQKVWGIKGDVESVAKFATTLHSFTLGDPDQDSVAQAKAIATMVAEAYGTFPNLVQHFGSDAWNETLDLYVGQNSAVLGKVGGTVGAALSNADDLFTPEAQEALLGAMITDMAVLWQPQLATALALHAMYKAGTNAYTNWSSKADLIQLFARNGQWEFPESGDRPKLIALHLGDTVITEDAAARKQQCALRARSSIARSDKAKTDPVGVEQVLRIIQKYQQTGVPLCARIKEGKCEPAETPKTVKPREAAMALFKSSPHAATDPLIIPIKDSINAAIGWGPLDRLRTLLFDDGTQWTAERLEDFGIYPATPEDASFVLPKIEVDMAPADWAARPRDPLKHWIGVRVWGNIGKGGRRILGYMASEYWVRRQYLMECVLLDEWITAAGHAAQKDDIEKTGIEDIDAQLALLDRRMRKLDEKVWPVFAVSYQPYPLKLDGQDYPADQKLAIYADYLKTTADARRDLRDIKAWFAGDQTADTMPRGALGRASLHIGSDDMLGIFDAADNLSDEGAERAATAALMLKRYYPILLTFIADQVDYYETGFDGVLKQVAGVQKRISAADGFKIGPAHVAIMGVGGFTPPGGKFGEVEDHLYPKGAWQGIQTPIVGSELLAGVDISTEGIATGGTIGKALSDWDKGYKTVRSDMRDALDAKLAPFQSVLVDETGGRIEPIYHDLTEPFEIMTGIQTNLLSQDHPLFARILRQAYQAHKIGLVDAQSARVSEVELQQVLLGMKTDGPEGKRPKAGNIDELKALKDTFNTMAGELIALAGNLFEIEIKGSDDADLYVTNHLEMSFTGTPRSGEGLPVVTEDDLKKWISLVYWEVARDPDFRGPVQRIGLDPERDIAFPQTLLADPDISKSVPPLMTCNAVIIDQPYERRIAVTRGGEDHKLKLPLVTPGVFYLRAVALGRGSVPLARKLMKFQVAPAELRGALKVTGTRVDIAAGQRVEVHVGGTPWRSLVAPQSAEMVRGWHHPVVTLHDSGLFRAQLCGELSHAMLNLDPVPPTMITETAIAGHLGATGYFFEDPRMHDKDAKAGDTVQAVAMEPGVFGLKEPVEIVMDDAVAVPVSVEVSDASGREITPRESAIIAAGAVHAGPGPVPLDLAEGDTVYAVAVMDVKGGEVDGQSPAEGFSVEDNAGELLLKVALDAYARGNLSVTGRLNIPDELSQYGGVSGGTVWSNLLPPDGLELSGSRLAFSNAEPVALANGMSLEALFYANDDVETYLTVTPPPPMRTLPRGGHIDLGTLDIALLRPKTFLLTVEGRDITGAPISDADGLTATLDGTPMDEAGDGVFTFNTSFRGRKQTRLIEMSYQTARGKVTGEVEITPDLIGDPLHPRDPEPVLVNLPVYESGSLRLSGRSRIIGADEDAGRPRAEFNVGFQGEQPIDPWQSAAGLPYVFDLSFAVPAGATLQVAGKARVGRKTYKGLVTAAAPDDPAGRPTTIAMPLLELNEEVELVAMPEMRNQDADEMKEKYGEMFNIQVVRVKDPPDEADINKVYSQAPLPDLPDKPSKVPTGITVTLAAYKDPTRAIVPLVRNMPLSAALARLAPLEIGHDTAPGRTLTEGEPTDLVTGQSPDPGTEIDPRSQSVLLYLGVVETASVEPEEEDPPPEEEDPPPEEDEDPDTAEEEDPLPVTPDLPPGVLSVTGGWTGTIRAKELHASSRASSLYFSINCTDSSVDACLDGWITTFAKLLEKEIKRQEGEEVEQDSNLLTLPADVIDGFMDSYGLIIIAGMGLLGTAMIEKLFDGVDYGMIVEQDDDKRITVIFPDSEGGSDKLLTSENYSVLEGGHLKISFDETFVQDKNGGALIAMEGTLRKTETGARFELTTTMKGVNEPAELRFTLVADMLPGEPGMTPIAPQLMNYAMNSLENPSPRFAARLKKFVKVIEELKEDD